MRTRIAVACAAVTLSAPAAAMDVATFIAKGEALKARGVMAMFSKDLKMVQAAAKDAAL